jgi:hypothetical protein
MAGKLEVIRDMDSNHRTEVAQVCVCSLTLHSGHVFKKNGILLKGRLCSRVKFRNALGFIKQSMVVWKMSSLNGFYHAQMNSIAVDGLTVKTKVIK